MGEPTMINIKDLLAAGINPKTGMPTKVESSSKCLKNSIKRQLTVLDEQDAINRYVWHSLPDGLTSQLIERVLYLKGQGMFFRMEADEKFYFLPYALDGSIDVYGRFMGVTPLPFGGSTNTGDKDDIKPWIKGFKRYPVYDIIDEEDPDGLKYFESGCVLLHDYTMGISQTIIPRSIIQEPILDIMSECMPFMRTSLANGTGISGVKVTSEDDSHNVTIAADSVVEAALEGRIWIPMVGKLEFQELTGGQTGKSEEYLLAMQAMDNYRLSLYGMDNGGLFQKKSHMLEAEQRMNSTNSGIIMQDGLLNRQMAADICNSIWGTSIVVEVNEVLTNTDTNGDGMVGYNQSVVYESYGKEETTNEQ